MQAGHRSKGSTDEGAGVPILMKPKSAARPVYALGFAFLFARQLELNNERFIALSLLSKAQISRGQAFKLDL
jgi:hypothetical protein